jgi:hypothetical protein
LHEFKNDNRATLTLKNNGLKYLLKNGGNIDFRVQSIYESMHDEIIDCFGISTDYKKQLKLQINIELMYSKMYAKNDYSMQLQINLLEDELLKLQSTKSNYDLYDSITAMNKAGINCDINTLTVYDYFKYSNSLLKISKQNEATK